MNHAMKPEKNGCNEYNALSRRQFLGGAMSTALALGLPAALPQVAFADGGTAHDVLVSIYLRGGSDGLTMCVPHGDAQYYQMRPNLAIPRPDSGSPYAAANLDGFFGLPVPMQSLMPAYNAGHLLFVQATGSTDPSRSHFDAQRYMEVGTPNDFTLFTGWLGRHLATSSAMQLNAPLRAYAFGSGLPLTLTGAPQTIPIPDPAYFGLDGNWETQTDRKNILAQTYALANRQMRAASQNTIRTIDAISQLNIPNYQPGGGAVYPENSYFSHGMKTAAAMIKAQMGVEAIHLDLGGWDTHSGQQPLNGYMANLMRELADSLAAFHTDIFSGNVTNVTVVVVSEFGRNVRENGSSGTDHGHGNMMMVLGDHIAGGRVLTQWPGLHPDQQFEGQDLAITIDHRDILAEIVQKRLNNNNLAQIFPGFTPTMRGVTHA